MFARFWEMHGEDIIGFAIVCGLVALALWILPPLDIPIREIGITLAALGGAYVSLRTGDWLSRRSSRLAKLLGKTMVLIAVTIVAGFVFVLIAFVFWSKLAGSPLSCAHCD